MKSIFKKIGAFALSAQLIVSSLGICVSAQTSDGLENAILSAKSKIEIPASLCEFDSNIYTTDEGTYYSLSWNDENYNSHISITVNQNADICDYYFSGTDESDNNIGFAEYTAEELKTKALDWLGKVNPGWISSLDAENADISGHNSIYSDRAYIRFNRIENGIGFLGNYASVTVNNRTGEICGMSSDWAYEENIPDPTEAIDEVSAGDEYFTLSPLELIYEGTDAVAKLVYEPKNPYVRINAREGGEIGDEYDYLSKNEAVTEDAAADTASGSSSANRLTESELANLEEIDGLLSEAELVGIAKALKNTGLDKAEFNSIRYERNYGYSPKNSEDEKQSYVAYLRFMFNADTENRYNGTVVLDAENGELIRYYAYDYSKYSEEPNVSADTALKSAEAFITEYSPAESKKVKLEENDGDEYYFNLVRYENDIPYRSNSLTVSVDKYSGYVSSFHKTWNDEITFESPDGVMDIGTAEQKFRENIGFELSYIYDYEPPKDGESPKKKVELCYTAADMGSYTLDAKTGEYINMYEEKEKVFANDISGHYAERQIFALIDAEVIEIDEENPTYRPDDVITKGELGYLVSRLTYRYYPYETTTAEARMRNLNMLLPSDEFDASAAALRKDGAVYIVRAAGYREVAELSDIFKCGFADADKIPAEAIGYISIAKGMGIVNGDENGCFNAENPLTRADAAIMIYNYLSR